MIEAKTNRTCSVHERACGQQAVQGDKGKPGGRRPLNREEEHELAKRIQGGERRALKLLVMADVELVTHLNRRYASLGLPMEDLISEGMLGLIEAAQRVDPHPGTRFATYAVRPLKRSVIKAVVEQRGAVSLPYHKSSLLFRIQQASRDLEQKKSSPVNLREVADVVGITEKQVHPIHHAGGSHVSLDALISSESSGEFYGLCDNERSPNPALILQSNEDHKRIQAAFGKPARPGTDYD